MSDLISAEKSKLYAVLIPDNFSSHFVPLTHEHSIALLPLCNLPIIQYNIEYLLTSGVDEIIVPITQHKAELTEFLQQRYGSNSKLRVVQCPAATSTGDILRHCESIQCIKSTFIVMHCTTICSVDLAAAVQQHKQNVKNDKFTFSTLVFTATQHAAHSTVHRALLDDTVMWLSSSNQILQLENDLIEQHTTIDSDLLHDKLRTHNTIDLRYDLNDCGIDICALDVLAEFRDNFDYNDMRRDFVHGVLSNQALGNTLYAHVVDNAYCCNITDLYTYNTVSQHLLQRQVLMYAPDMNVLNDYSDVNYTYNNGIYHTVDNTLSLADGVVIIQPCMFGTHVSVQSHTTIQKSIVGHNAKIGKNCEIVNSYIWSDVTIEDNVKMYNCVIAANAVIKAGAAINSGCIVSYGVTVGSGFSMKAHARATTLPPESDTFSDDEADATTARNTTKYTEFGNDSNGRVYTADGEDTDEAYADLELTQYNLNSMLPDKHKFLQKIHTIGTESVDEVDELDEDDVDIMSVDSSTATVTVTSTAATQSPVPIDQLQQSIAEVIDTVQRGNTEKLDIDGVVLEMSSLKLSRDMSTQEYAHAAFRGIFNLIQPASVSKPVAASQGTVQLLGSTLKHWSPILSKYSKSESDQLIFLYGLEDACLDNGGVYSKLFAPTLQLLYDVYDVFEEDAILQWDELRQQSKNAPQYQLWQSAAEFLKWLKSAEDESDDDDD